jgi:hypothetical protein
MPRLRVTRCLGLRRRACVTALASFLASTSTASASEQLTPEQPLQRSPDPPSWTRTATHCVADLTSARYPSGRVGYIGYNAYELLIVRRRHASCRRAKRFARTEWIAGPAVERMHWRYARGWQSTAGSAYFGDFVGNGVRVQIEYLAVH